VKMKELQLHIGDKLTSIVIGSGLVSNLSTLKGRKLVLLVDENVLKLHSELFAAYSCITIPSGEKYKTVTFVESVYLDLVDKEVDRSSILVGVGGGMTTDIAGYVASTYMRGIEFGFISTTLLGQVDASIGGKNGVNLDGYKNMIGTIRQPSFVWCDLSLLETLERNELVSGLSEVVKYGAIREPDLLNNIEKNTEDILSLKPEAMAHIVTVSAQSKIDIVESDVFEKGDRKLLNFGHTLGHAIEKLTGILHGEAVSIGMVLAANLSVKLGYLKESESLRLEKILLSLGLPVQTDLPMGDIYTTLLKDKKRAGEMMHFILLNGIGEAFIKEIQLDKLEQLLHDLY
jgi:3-dehydroquinate synthase